MLNDPGTATRRTPKINLALCFLLLLLLLCGLAIFPACIAHPLVQPTTEEESDGAILALLASPGTNTAGDPGSTGLGFKRLFITTAGVEGDLFPFNGPGTPIEDFDGMCSVDANNPDPGSTFKALVAMTTARRACSTGNCSGGASEHIDWVLQPDTEYRRVDGVTVVGRTLPGAGIFDLSGAGLNAPIEGVGREFRTALTADWRYDSGGSCFDWSMSGLGDSSGGNSGLQGTGAINDGGPKTCDIGYPVLCVEQ